MKRRTFLKGIGCGLGGAILPTGITLGQEGRGTPPQRLVILHTQHGAWTPTWNINPWGHGKESYWSEMLSGLTAEEFSPSLRELHAYRSRMTLVKGTALLSAEADQSNLRHQKGMAHSLTGSFSSFVPGAVLAGGPSVDQVIAAKIGRPDRWRSLELGVGDIRINSVYQGPRQMLPAMKDPLLVHDRLFQSTGLYGTVTENAFEARSLALERAIQRFQQRKETAAKWNRQVFELHQDLLSDIGTRIQGLGTLACDPPEAPEPTVDFEMTYQALIPQIVAALSCDMTRVITIQLGDLPGSLIGHPGDVHDLYAHRVHEDPSSAKAMTDYVATHARQVRDLLDALDAIPEGNGTVLDNTTVAWLSEMGSPAHGFNDWPVAFFGGRGLQMGRVFHYPQTIPFYEDSLVPGVEVMGLPHQRVLVTLAQSMGVSIDALGETELMDAEGQLVDCTGALTEVLSG